MTEIQEEMPPLDSEGLPDDGQELTEADKLFLEQRAAIAEAIKDDQKHREMLAEMYLFYANMDKAMRSLAMNGGMKGMIKMLMGKGDA